MLVLSEVYILVMYVKSKCYRGITYMYKYFKCIMTSKLINFNPFDTELI